MGNFKCPNVKAIPDYIGENHPMLSALREQCGIEIKRNVKKEKSSFFSRFNCFKNEAPTVIAPAIASPLEPIKGPQKLVFSALPAVKQAMPEKKYKSLRKEVKTLLE